MKFGDEARNALKTGIQQIANAVGCTLGPATKSVIINRQGDIPPLVVNDGVTVAKHVVLKDPYEYAGAKLLIEVAQRAQEQAGDGTTTATVLAAAFIEHGFAEAAKGERPRAEIRRELEDASEEIISQIKELTVPITKDEEITMVATISANGDKKLAELITSAFKEVGKEGIVTVEPSTNGEDNLTIVDGYECEKGYISPIFKKILGPKTVYENALVLVSNASIQSFDELVPAIKISQEAKKPLVVFAREISGAALQSVAINVSAGNFQMCIVQAEDISFWQDERLGDLSAVTGSKFFNEQIGMRLSNAVSTDMADVGKVIITSDRTTLIDYEGDEIEKRSEEIKRDRELSDGEFHYKKHSSRLARLASKAAIISVFGISEQEVSNKLDRLDDALNATRAALEEGVTPGCASSFTNMAASDSLPLWIRDSLMAPVCKIMSNYNDLSFKENMSLVKKAEKDMPIFYDGKIVTWTKASKIIDPAKVVISSLRSAVSVAGYVLTAECVIGE